MEIDYLSRFPAVELTDAGIVEPMQVATIDGHWYLDAYCHRAGDMRRFRVDRIGAVRPLERSPGPAQTQARPLEEMFVPGPGAVEVHLQLGPGAQWVPESVPVRAVRRDADGTVSDVVLDVSGMAWFERLLLQLGPEVRVVSPPELTGLAGDAAHRAAWRVTPLARRITSPHERHGRFQSDGDRGIPGQPWQGRWRVRRRTVVLLTTTGAKSGKKRVNPLVRALVQGDTLYVVASKAGAPTSPDWYHNLVANPEVEVEFGDEHFSATAVPIVSGPDRDRLYAAQVAVQPGFADYEKATTRVIPVVELRRT